jgi:hypothetical protein
MHNYVRSRLISLEDEDLKSYLATEIQEKSSGIFLWTYLVVKTIRNKMTHKATSELLRKHLNTLPRGLASLFYHILQQLEPDDARKTLRIIDALQTAKSNGLTLLLLTFSLLDEYDADSAFSLRDGLEHEPIPDGAILQAQLRGACGGLIESLGGSRHGRLKVFEFVHRSVPDNFQNETEHSELARQMQVALHGTNNIDIISHLCLATLWLLGEGKTGDVQRSTCKSIASMRLRYRLDKPPYYFLEYIASLTNYGWLEDSEVKWQCSFYDFPQNSDLYIRPYGEAFSGNNSPRLLYNSMCLAALSGHMDYFEWIITNNANALNNSAKRSLDGHSILISKHWGIFFEKKAFTMDPTIPLVPATILGGWGNDDSVAPDSVALSAWQLFLSYIILNMHWNLSGFVDDLGNVIERFLRQGADPYCRIIIAYEVTGMYMTIFFRDSKTHHVIRQDSVRSFLDVGVQVIMERCLKLKGEPPLDWDTNFTEQFSFREWVAVTDSPNRETLLELLDGNCE